MALDFWRDRPVLVTGAAGLLGSWTARALLEAGARVVGLVRDDVPDSELNASGVAGRIVLARGALEDASLIERVLNEYEIDTAFHFGAQAAVGPAARSPLSTFRSNVEGTWNVLEGCRRISTVKRVILASSDKVYGGQDHLPSAEDAPLRGRHPYDASKRCAETLAECYVHTYGLPVVVARCANVFGGGDLNFSRLVPGTIRSVLRGQAPVIRSDGAYVRDYLYVEDAVRAYLALASLFGELDLKGRAFNFSAESPLTVLEMVAAILRIMESDREPVILNQAPGEIRRQSLSSEKAREILGWRPRLSLEEGLRRTVAWYRSYLNPR